MGGLILQRWLERELSRREEPRVIDRVGKQGA